MQELQPGDVWVLPTRFAPSLRAGVAGHRASTLPVSHKSPLWNTKSKAQNEHICSGNPHLKGYSHCFHPYVLSKPHNSLLKVKRQKLWKILTNCRLVCTNLSFSYGSTKKPTLCLNSALSTVQTLAVVGCAPWSSPARDQRAKTVGREKTETVKIGGHFCTMACEHKSHSASKKWITVKRFWPCYSLYSTDKLNEISYLVIYMASIRAMSEHSQTRWIFPHCAPKKEHMLLTLHHRQGVEILKRQNVFSRETSIWSDKILYNARGLL